MFFGPNGEQFERSAGQDGVMLHSSGVWELTIIPVDVFAAGSYTMEVSSPSELQWVEAELNLIHQSQVPAGNFTAELDEILAAAQTEFEGWFGKQQLDTDGVTYYQTPLHLGDAYQSRIYGSIVHGFYYEAMFPVTAENEVAIYQALIEKVSKANLKSGKWVKETNSDEDEDEDSISYATWFSRADGTQRSPHTIRISYNNIGHLLWFTIL